jgi:lipoprotein-anchoring transpeptidase ErfK/SrfK
VPGTVSADGSTWTSTGQLGFDTGYRYEYTVRDAAGRQTHKTESFHTVVKANEANAWTYIGNGVQVGVAQPVQITFSEPVTNKAAVEKAIRITTSDGRTGAFHWYSDTMVRYRPEAFWTANSTVSVDMELFGVDFGNGQIGNFNKKVTMKIGDKKVAVADAVAKTFDVYVNDVLTKQWPVTMGDERFPSAPGYLVMMDHQRNAHFVASTIGLKPGDPADYGELDVEYATRLTPSGEFIHGAPWAAQYFGVTNISHGCIGMSLDGAGWVFNNMGVGDTVQVVNSAGEPALLTDGFQDWNIPWAQYAN